MELVNPCEKRAPSLAGMRLILSKRPNCWRIVSAVTVYGLPWRSTSLQGATNQTVRCRKPDWE